MAEDETQVDVLHYGKDTVINILHKEGDEDNSVNTNKENDVANTTLNLDLNSVKVVAQNPYVVLENVDDPKGSDVRLNGAEIVNLGDGILQLTLECGDIVNLKAEPVIAALIRACDLPVVA